MVTDFTEGSRFGDRRVADRTSLVGLRLDPFAVDADDIGELLELVLTECHRRTLRRTFDDPEVGIPES